MKLFCPRIFFVIICAFVFFYVLDPSRSHQSAANEGIACSLPAELDGLADATRAVRLKAKRPKKNMNVIEFDSETGSQAEGTSPKMSVSPRQELADSKSS